MSALNINKDNFLDEVLNSDKPVLLDFWAPWCGPCRRVVPLVEEIAQERPDIKVGKVNVDEEYELASRFRVVSIPTLLVIRDGKVVKGRNFEGIRDVADPVEMAAFYNESGADELVFYDITASVEQRQLFTDILTKVASQIFIPLTVGGGINTIEDFDRVLKCGADKVSVNSGAIRNPQLIEEGAKKYGDQCVVLSMDIKRVDGKFHLFAKGGREDTGIDALQWTVDGVNRGAGELVVNSIDTDGVKEGFDLELLDEIAARVNVPIIASGGAGKMEDFAELFRHPGIDAGLAASIFHFKEVAIRDLKMYLRGEGVEVRL
jgi:cyclase